MPLSSQIEKAFANTTRPRGDELFATDSEGAAELFCGREWHEMQSSDLDRHAFALHAFSPTAFVYYLPAYMLAALENENLGLSDNLIDCLSPPKNDPLRPSFANRWLSLTPLQQQAVTGFLLHFAHRNPIAIQAAVSALEATIEG